MRKQVEKIMRIFNTSNNKITNKNGVKSHFELAFERWNYS
jgi:hypothetical protein